MKNIIKALRADRGWSQAALADQLGAPVDRPQVLETTAMGAAWLAGQRMGIYPDQDAFARSWALDRSFAPAMDEETRATKYAAWKRAVDATIRF